MAFTHFRNQLYFKLIVSGAQVKIEGRPSVGMGEVHRISAILLKPASGMALPGFLIDPTVY